MNRRALHLLAGALVAGALVLGGCGGGDDNSGTTAASAGTTETSGAGASQPQSGAQQGAESATGSESNNSFTLGSPADVPRSEGGDNSIQDYGLEASTADRAAAGRALAAYYDALAKGDTEQACALLASATREGVQRTLEQLSAQGNSKTPTSCPEILRLTTNAGSRRSPEQRLSELLSLRQQDDRAFLIYKAGDGKVYSIAMADEDGDWKVGGVTASPLGA